MKVTVWSLKVFEGTEGTLSQKKIGSKHGRGSHFGAAGNECTKKMQRLRRCWGAGQRDGLAAAEDTDLELQAQSGSEMSNFRLTMKPSKRATEAA